MRSFRTLAIALAASACFPIAAWAVTDFLLDPGTNGFISAPANWISTEINSLGNGNGTTSTAGGASGVFSQSSSSNAIWGSCYFTAGGSFTPTAGGYLAGWFERSTDGGVTFETSITSSSTIPAFPRSPDFIIPVYAGGSAVSTNNIQWCQGGYIKLPWESYKVVIQNFSGVALPASGNTIKFGGVAVHYN